MPEQKGKPWRRFRTDKAGWFRWYWRRPDQMPFQVGPYKLRTMARLAAWRATRGG